MLKMTSENKNSLCARPVGAPVRGRVGVGGDKSISHRALIFAAFASGRTEITGLCEGADVHATLNILRALGVEIIEREGIYQVDGRGLGGLRSPDSILDCGNSGTTARLMLGVLASHRIDACLTGDLSLRGRPMNHVLLPLTQMGAQFKSADTRLPLYITGTKNPLPIELRTAVPSAQLKSAILLAGLNAPGQTTIIEERPTRDHTERMITKFGGEVDVMPLEGDGGGRDGGGRDGGGRDGVQITVTGERELRAPERIMIAGDPSSAAFMAALAALVEGSELVIERVCVNPHRMGFYETLKEMGAKVEVIPHEVQGDQGLGEPVADIKIQASALKGVDISADRAAGMIDEYPILSVVAACARGSTHMRGLSQLRVKESNRLVAIAENLQANGITAEIRGDDLTIVGGGSAPPGGGQVATYGDHRIAMAFLVLGACAQKEITIDDGSAIATSFPDFVATMRGLGVDIS